MNDNEYDIDQLLGESLRRRGASAQIGGGTIADVHRRIVRRRRRLVAGVATAIAVPALIGVAALAGSRDDSGRVASPAAEAGSDAPPTTLAPTPPVVCRIEVTSGSVAGTPEFGTFCDVGAVEPGVPVPSAAPIGGGGWRCLGDPVEANDGWTYYTTCEPVCTAIDVAPPTTAAFDDLPSTTVAPVGPGPTTIAVALDDIASTTIVFDAATTTEVPPAVTATVVETSPALTTIVTEVVPSTAVPGPVVELPAACVLGAVSGVVTTPTTIAG